MAFSAGGDGDDHYDGRDQTFEHYFSFLVIADVIEVHVKQCLSFVLDEAIFTACGDPRAERPKIAKMTDDEMIKWFKSAPKGSRHQRMLWAARKMAHLTGMPKVMLIRCCWLP